MNNINVLPKVLSPGIVSVDCPTGRFQHEIPLHKDNSCVLDLASPLYGPSSRLSVYDRSGYGNHGTITGAVWTKLPSGLWVLRYDGIDDFLAIPNALGALAGALPTFTLSMWVYPITPPAGNDTVFSRMNATIWVRITATTLKLTTNAGVGVDTTISTNFVVNKGAFLAFVYNGANQYVMRDMRVIGSSAQTGSIAALGDARGHWVGDYAYDALPHYPFDGYISDVRFNTIPLTVPELAEIYDRTRGFYQ